ncbi:MAG: FAD-binding protein [Coriobacteriia bacterium]|nr:FAD-binding protein [Coriobacteriia bacterium]
MKEEEVDRRGFLKGAVGVGAVVAGLVATGCTSKVATEVPAWDHEVDVAVAGFGIGGSSASLAAQKTGAKVLCVEAYSQVGGTAVDSGGGAAGPASIEAAMATMPYGNRKLLQTFVEGMPKVTEMIVKSGAPVRASSSGFTIGAESTHKSRLACFEFLAKTFTDAGGTLLMDTKAIKLLTSGDGTVDGLQARDKGGKILNIKAKAVILACGGFQNNPEMKTKFLGPYGDQVVARSVPTNDGTGMLMAQAIGAGLSKSLGTFYGHSIASNIDLSFMEFSEIGSQYHDNRSIVVNLDGVRFADEGMGLAGDLCNEALARQRWGRGCLIFDQYIYDKWGSTTAGGTPTGIDRTQEVLKRGGHVVSANTIEELAGKIAAWGYNRASVIKTVTDYNAAVDAGATANLPVPRTAGMIASIVKIAKPPFWATEVVGGMSCCFGGLAINAKAEVLKADGGAPIPGLYAVPGTAGGITFVHYYVSSIGAAAAFGWASAQNAVEYAKSK